MWDDAMALVVIWVLLKRRQQTRRCLIAAGLTFLGYLPWVSLLAGQTARVNRNGFWVPPVPGLGILAAIIRPFSHRELFLRSFPDVRPWMATAVVLSAILVITGVVLMLKRRAKTELAFGMLLLG